MLDILIDVICRISKVMQTVIVVSGILLLLLIPWVIVIGVGLTPGGIIACISADVLLLVMMLGMILEG